MAATLLGEYLAGALVVLMLSGGEALEAFALGRASSVLQALARRMPLVAHRRADRQVVEVPLDGVRIDDELIVYHTRFARSTALSLTATVSWTSGT